MAGGAMLNVRFQVEGIIVVDRVLQGIEDRARDLRPAWPGVVKAFQLVVGRAFQTEGASTGDAWKPLAPSTQADRRRHGFPSAHPILQRTQKLERALVLGQGAFVAGQPTSLRYQLSPDVGYFVYHQSVRPRTKLPRRAPVELTFDDRTAIMHPIRLYLTGRSATPAVQESAA
jgi:hypothetical protein